MKTLQWFTFGLGLTFLSTYLFTMTFGWHCGFDSIADQICNARKYSYGIPAIISFFLGMIFNICAILEVLDKK